MPRKKLFKKGSTSYKVLLFTVVFIMLGTAILAPIFLVEGGNRTLGTILAIILGTFYVLVLLYYLYEWIKQNPDVFGKE